MGEWTERQGSRQYSNFLQIRKINCEMQKKTKWKYENIFLFKNILSHISAISHSSTYMFIISFHLFWTI